MLRISLFLVLVLFLQSSSLKEEDKLIAEQKEIIAKLSGHQAFANNKHLNSRSTKQERLLAREYLFSLIQSIGLTPEQQTYEWPNVNPLVDLLFDPFKGANVYTILPATQASNDYLVLGAHYDTERHCPGAIDNATGIAIGLSAVKKLAELDQRNVHVILVYFDQEEEDLIGSQAFAKKLIEEEFNVLSVHTFDTMGWDRDGDRAVELELPTPFLEALYKKKAAQLDIPIHTTRVNSTDHHSFRELGFAATGLTDEFANGDYAPFKDTPKDTYETVNFNYVASSTELVYQVAKEIIQQ